MRTGDFFNLTENHIKLLGELIVESDGYGPQLESKRPYGNSAIAYDVYEIVNGYSWSDGDEGEMDEYTQQELMDLHNDLEYALQIILQLKTFEIGRYELLDKKHYPHRWGKA